MSRASRRLVPPPPSSEAVRAVMQGNRGQDTKPEMLVRRLLFAQGYRYRGSFRVSRMSC